MRLLAHVDRDEALRYLGYGGQVVDCSLERRLDQAIEACERDLVPQGVYRFFKVDRARAAGGNAGEGHACTPSTPSVALEGTGLVLEGHDIVAHVGRARQVALMACTLGMESERQLRRRGALGPTDALLYSAAASSLVESAADALCTRIAATAAAGGLVVGGRFSPGYGDFPLEAQPAFLAAIDAQRSVGIAVTEGNVLVPTKSITAVVGAFELRDGELGRKAGNGKGSAVADGTAFGVPDMPPGGKPDAAPGGAPDGKSGAAVAGAGAGVACGPGSEGAAGTACARCSQKSSCAFRREGTTCYDH